MTRYLVLTPMLDGADGISELSRQVVQALVQDADAERVEAWTLAGGAPALPAGDPVPRFRTARGSRWRLLGWAFGPASRPFRAVTVIVMHVHLAPIAGVLALRGARVVMLLIGWEVWRRLRPRERHVLAKAHRVIAISQHTLRRFRESNPDARTGPAVVCPLGIGPAAVDASACANEAALRGSRVPEDGFAWPASAFGLPEDGFALIVSRMWSQERYKGHDWLIDVWPAVRRLAPGARLVVVGDGDDRPRLQERVAAGGLDSAIRFTGQISDSRLAELYRASAFFVMPSTNEGFGLVYLEAMRAGKPCIAVHGAADEIIVDGETGFLVNVGDSEALTGSVVRLFVDRELRSRLGASAAARVAHQFTAEHFAARFRAALDLPGSGPASRQMVPVL